MLPHAEHSCRSGVNQLYGTPAPSPRALRSFAGQVREDPQTDLMRSWLIRHPWPNYILGSQIKHVRRSDGLKPKGGLSPIFTAKTTQGRLSVEKATRARICSLYGDFSARSDRRFACCWPGRNLRADSSVAPITLGAADMVAGRGPSPRHPVDAYNAPAAHLLNWWCDMCIPG